MLPHTPAQLYWMLDTAKAVCLAIESQYFGALYMADSSITYGKIDLHQFDCVILNKHLLFFNDACP